SPQWKREVLLEHREPTSGLLPLVIGIDRRLLDHGRQLGLTESRWYPPTSSLRRCWFHAVGFLTRNRRPGRARRGHHRRTQSRVHQSALHTPGAPRRAHSRWRGNRAAASRTCATTSEL